MRPLEKVTRKHWEQVPEQLTEHGMVEQHSDERAHVRSSLDFGGIGGTNSIHGAYHLCECVC